MRNRPRLSWPVLALVVLVHALFFAWAMVQAPPSAPVITPPMVGILVSAASSAGNSAAAPAASHQTSTAAFRQQEKHPRPSQTRQTIPEKKTADQTEKTRTAPATRAAGGPTSEGDAASAGNHTGSTGKTGGTEGTGGAGRFFSPRVDAYSASNPKPRYPATSRRMGEEGTVTLSVHILSTGVVAEVRLKKSSGYLRLDDAAIQAVKKWRYVPARQGDTPINYWYTQAVKFSLTD